jgi:coproporphyrinogen III oxidase-like Fe-S oxidoreductase
MGLRLAEGVDLGDIAARTGVKRENLLDARATGRLLDLGLIREIAQGIALTDSGTPLLDRILAEIVAI